VQKKSVDLDSRGVAEGGLPIFRENWGKHEQKAWEREQKGKTKNNFKTSGRG